MVGMVSLIEFNNDSLEVITTSTKKIVFLTKGSFVMVMVSDICDSTRMMKNLLEYMHLQIISILTTSIQDRLTSNPGYDVRNIMEGSDRFFDNIERSFYTKPNFVVDCTSFVRLSGYVRNTVGSILKKCTENESSIFMVALVAKNKLLQLVRKKKYEIHTYDLHLFLNFIQMNEDSFRTSETTLSPICFPKFISTGFLYQYVSYIPNTEICLALVTVDPEDISPIVLRDDIVEALEKENMVDYMQRSISSRPYTVMDLQIPGVIHFIYRSLTKNQMTSPEFSPPFDRPNWKEKILQIYDQTLESVHTLSDSHKLYFRNGLREKTIYWKHSAFELCVICVPFLTKEEIHLRCKQILKWISNEEINLFNQSIPVW
eukprot:TRINITY_DN2556_c0_g1_i2.p1 TRINITY_DN2556_c0_g1~~TRINITY_DN2556_c0_g1_i2.p1  ORF type:complete len:373 (+),score=47.24 TRINITY_DN2556_c0_g1_i2:273-1391(+)